MSETVTNQENKVLVSAPSETVEAAQALIVEVASLPLYKYGDRAEGETTLQWLEKSSVQSEGTSSQGSNQGRKQQPFNFEAAATFQTSNEHHSTCIQTKVSSTVGLGFVDSRKTVPATETEAQRTVDVESKVDTLLNPFCDVSFTDVLLSVIEDYWEVANGYMEVVRSDDGTIKGLHHIQAAEVFVFLEDDLYNYHYEIVGKEGTNTRRFARFGDLEDFKNRMSTGTSVISKDELDRVSEVIHFRRPSAKSRWYGYPDWLACVPSIELVQCLHQFKYDFFLNRGVPEFMLFITGGKLSTPDWKLVTDAIRANIGLGNSHKSLALNLANPDIEITLEKLAVDGKAEESFEKTKENLALGIVTTHQVPPLLAGILIPGKLGATNELPNALMAFQTLKIGPNQRIIQQTLGCTLGNSERNGGLGLKPEDFLFRKITEEIDVGTMDTVSRMRETVPEAKAKGRKLDEGLKD